MDVVIHRFHISFCGKCRSHLHILFDMKKFFLDLSEFCIVGDGGPYFHDVFFHGIFVVHMMLVEAFAAVVLIHICFLTVKLPLLACEDHGVNSSCYIGSKL